MIRLIVVNNPRMAQGFIDYMASRNIDVQMMPEGQGQFVLWLVNDEDQLETEAELKQFLQQPNDAKYLASSWDMAESRKNTFRYQGPSLLSYVRAKAGVFTLAIMVLSIVVYGLQSIGFGESVFSLLHFPSSEAEVLQVWRWVTHAILHFSVTHIVFNLLWWWQFGGDIEQELGSKKLLEIFLVSAAISGLGQYWFSGINFGGLSGVVYALMGYLWILTYYRTDIQLTIPKPIIGFMLVWLVLGFVQPYLAIANAAHTLGLVSGMALGWIDSKRLKRY
ncbi:rhomboid family intramembrane serine protease GlpG [Vibrio hippocampi]|uniref:Rhomboid protease GlpG n=1 Tax=Vibrio hippocampi TaxID=654686 RepID=A0ABM8ZK62_9VIBR|nr:rhomboid family intramembrane serine protease GlpG [Vibrio hippocampi]CAH0527331.1 Rhomboid protease GlpG [Vibrio hippocampi]